MMTLQGKGASRGMAMGRARLLRRVNDRTESDAHGDPTQELGRYKEARDVTVEELQTLYERLRHDIGEEQAEIFKVQAMMVGDEDLEDAIRHKISAGHRAEFAVRAVGEQFASVFETMEDEYMRARAEDVRQVTGRMLEHLSGGARMCVSTDGSEGQIICAEDLSPAETVGLDRSVVRGIVTARGSTNSHTAILARTLGIPAVVGIGEGWQMIDEGAMVMVDGERGTVCVGPDEKMQQEYHFRQNKKEEEQRSLLAWREAESRTADGTRIEICANIGNIHDLQDAIQQGCDGIGLLRSEFIYMGREDLPGEDEQLGVYRRVLQAMEGKRVVVRTLDVGADKQAACIPLMKEENPALGLRGARVSLTHPEVFLTQCRALLRASVYGNLAVMFPMITSPCEVTQLRALWDQAREQLKERGIPCRDKVDIGIMIETPAAALVSDRLAPLVDFFSIGSNDLSQYTLAMDRQNEALDAFYDPRHEAVLGLMSHAAKQAKAHGIWVGICGELGADEGLTEEFLRMGITEFSVVPRAILPLRRKVCSTTVQTINMSVPNHE